MSKQRNSRTRLSRSSPGLGAAPRPHPAMGLTEMAERRKVRSTGGRTSTRSREPSGRDEREMLEAEPEALEEDELLDADEPEEADDEIRDADEPEAADEDEM